MVDFHDRRRGPVSDVLDGLYDSGTRYRVHTSYSTPEGQGPFTGVEEGHLTPVPGYENAVGITKSTKSKGSVAVGHEHILKIEDARAARDGSRTVHYERPAHRQSGYGRI